MKLRADIIDFSIFTFAQINFQAQQSAQDTAYLNDELVSYLQTELNSMNGLPQSICADYADTLLKYIKDGLVGLGSNIIANHVNIVITEDIYETSSHIVDTYEDIKSSPNKIEQYINRVVAGMQASGFIIENEKSGRYQYFISYLNNRSQYDSPDDEIFQTVMDYNFFAIKDSTYISSAIDLTTWITGKDSWSNHRETIERWAEYLYSLKQYVNTDVHEYSKSVVPNSCESNGFTEYKCRYCGRNYISDYTKATGHDFLYNADGNVVTAICKNDNSHRSMLKLETPNTQYSAKGYDLLCMTDSITEMTGAKLGDITYYYSDDNGNNVGDALQSPPIYPGKYVATIEIAGVEARSCFIIEKKQLSASIDGYVKKTYDGDSFINDSAESTLKINLRYVMSGDDVSATADFAYADAGVGESITINATNIKLLGKDAANYNLANTSTTAAVGSIVNAEQTLPDNVKPNILTEDCTSIIFGVSKGEDVYEYSMDKENWNETAFDDLSGEQSFYFRLKAKPNYSASESKMYSMIFGHTDEDDDGTCDKCNIIVRDYKNIQSLISDVENRISNGEYDRNYTTASINDLKAALISAKEINEQDSNVRGYLTYIDKDGVTVTIYTDILEGVLN